MIVALIGCDGTGKSTCFNKLDKSLGTFVKGVQLKGNMSKWLINMDYMAHSDHLYIFDRIQIIDDFVYSPIFNKGKPSDLMSILDEIRRIAKKCKFIYFTCPGEELIKRLEVRGDEYVSKEDIITILRNYEETFKLLKITPAQVIDTGKYNEDQVKEAVEKCILQK